MNNALRYGGAICASTAILAGIPTTLYVGLIIWTNDMGGVLNLIIIPFVSGLIGFLLNLLVFLPFTLVGERYSISKLKLVLCFIGAFLLLFMIPFIGFYGFHGQVKSPVSNLCLIGTGLFLYMLVGLLAQLFAVSLFRKVFP